MQAGCVLHGGDDPITEIGAGATIGHLCVVHGCVIGPEAPIGIRDVRAASSLVAFLRSLGGTIGVTLLGVVLNTRVTELSGTSSGLGGLATDTAAEAEAVRAAYGDGLALVFGIAGCQRGRPPGRPRPGRPDRTDTVPADARDRPRRAPARKARRHRTPSRP